jgi:hypothetical protein
MLLCAVAVMLMSIARETLAASKLELRHEGTIREFIN